MSSSCLLRERSMIYHQQTSPNQSAAANGGFASRLAIHAQRPAVAELDR